MGKRQYFGTDGIRGRANSHPITAEVAMKVGLAAGAYFRTSDQKHRVVIGKDPRRSSYMLEAALTAGFCAMGVEVYHTGPIPTPAVGMLTRALRADVGVMISASHNPHHDNGIKLFGPDGYKLSDEAELEIERLMDAGVGDLPSPDDLARVIQLEDAGGRYIEFAKNTLPRGASLAGLKVVVDCANGAAYKTAPAILWELGAEVITLGVEPNGFNINKNCGSTAPQACQRAVVEHGAHLGVTLDGDADRVHVIDEKGQIVDGDQLMALIGDSWAQQGRLRGGGVVATVMSNMGLERFMDSRGLTLARTAVGDRYVVARMRAEGYNVGGEQSGHIVLNDFVTTGDGAIAALQVLAEAKRLDRPVSEVCAKFEAFPQILKNVRFAGGAPLETDKVKAAIRAGEEKLGDDGRLVIRKSGTEPLIRVMGEAQDAALLTAVIDDICDAVTAAG